MGLDFLVPVFAILVVLVPVLGFTIIATLRWGLTPFVEHLARELEGSGFVAPRVLEARVEELSRELEVMTEEVRRLQEAQEFDRRLLEPATPGEGSGDAEPSRR